MSRNYASEILAKARARQEERRKKEKRGVLVAEGDSWFSYPGTDVIEELEDLGYDVLSVANASDTIESMAYNPRQLKKLALKLTSLADDDQIPKAILLSGGGNDFAGEALEMFLNHSGSSLDPLNEDVAKGAIDVRMRAAYVRVIGTIARVSAELYGSVVKILVHGYAHPVPDGRGFAGGFWWLPGPWLEPSFRRKGYADLERNKETMRLLVDRFNVMLVDVVEALNKGGQASVGYVDLRNCLTNGRNYRDDWSNELHPTDAGFSRVAEAFREEIERPAGGGRREPDVSAD